MTFYWIKKIPEPAKQLVAIHGVTGSIMRFHGLAKGLNLSVGGIQAQGVNPGPRPLASIHEMANQYLQEVWDIPTAHLLGYCWGGLVAYEMSEKIKGKLILIDPPVPLSGKAGNEIAAERVKNRKRPKDPHPFDEVTIACWNAANSYRPRIPKTLREALIIWSQDTFIKLSRQRQELRPEAWNQYLSASHLFIDINQKDLFAPQNLARISNIIEGYL